MTAGEWRARLEADPRFAARRAEVAADRPALTQEQIAILRPIFRPVIPLMTNTAPAVTEAASRTNRTAS